MSKGKFIVFDGINGCGKGIAVDTLGEYYESQGKKVFDLRKYMLEEHRLPEAEELKKYDVILSCEPTNAWVGAAIRNEMFYDNGRDYGPDMMVTAFSLDRLILFKRLLMPLKEMGKLIFQERSISTTFIQQPLHGKGITIKKIMNYEGHKYILRNLPDHLVVIDADPERAIKWRSVRTKQDHDIYEIRSLQEKHRKRYHASWFREIFESRRSKIHYIENSGSLEEFKVQVIKFTTSLV